MSRILCLLVAAAPACTLAQVDVTVDEVCLTYPDLEVPESRAAAAIAQSFVFEDLGPIHHLLDTGADLAFVRAEVRTSDADALAGVQRASLGLASNDPGSTLPHLIVYACDGNCERPDASLELLAGHTHEAFAYLSASSLAVDLSASGALPAHAWSMAVDVCVSGHAHYAFDPSDP